MDFQPTHSPIESERMLALVCWNGSGCHDSQPLLLFLLLLSVYCVFSKNTNILILAIINLIQVGHLDYYLLPPSLWKSRNSMPTLTKLYTMQEAAQHNTPQDCWIVIEGKVYDVGSYLEEHPGGDDVILATTGKDATDEFEDAGHSRSARELLETFWIGELDLSATVIPELEISKKQADCTQKLKDLTRQNWAIPVAVIGVSVVIGFLYLRKK